MENEERQQLLDDAQTRIRDETDKLITSFLTKVDQQIALGILLARISPSTSYVYATAALAGSGLGEFASLREYIKKYRQDFMAKTREITATRRRQAESMADREEQREIMEAPIDPGDLPQFAPGRADLSAVLDGGQTDLLILMVLRQPTSNAAKTRLRFSRTSRMKRWISSKKRPISSTVISTQIKNLIKP